MSDLLPKNQNFQESRKTKSSEMMTKLNTITKRKIFKIIFPRNIKNFFLLEYGGIRKIHIKSAYVLYMIQGILLLYSLYLFIPRYVHINGLTVL